MTGLKAALAGLKSFGTDARRLIGNHIPPFDPGPEELKRWLTITARVFSLLLVAYCLVALALAVIGAIIASISWYGIVALMLCAGIIAYRRLGT